MIDPELDHEQAPASASDATVRQFAMLCTAALGAAAARDIWFRGAVGRGAMLAGLALTMAVSGLARPRMVRPWFVAALKMTMPIGVVVSLVLLAIMYYLIFTPLACVFRLVGRDALLRRRQAGVRSYWVAKERPSDVRTYFRQS